LKRNGIPSISGLTSFIAAAEYQSFTLAAGKLKLSQGAISRHIRELEGHLGTRLFERVRQRVVLTEAGKLYLLSVKKPLDELAQATRTVGAFSDGTVLNLAVVPAFATRWLLPRLPHFQKKHPHIMVHVTMRQRAVDFTKEPFDAAITFDPPPLPSTVAHHLIDTYLVPVCSPKLVDGIPINKPADIVKLTLLHKMSRPTRWPEWMAEAGVEAELALRGQTFPQMSMLAEAAISGLGVALLPQHVYAADLVSNRLTIIGAEFVTSKLSYYLIMPDAGAASDVMQTFAHWLMSETQIKVPGRQTKIASGKPLYGRRISGSPTRIAAPSRT
jgi:LysR family transcriptional regulator, glycine cleavage system transcriptional activator